MSLTQEENPDLMNYTSIKRSSRSLESVDDGKTKLENAAALEAPQYYATHEYVLASHMLDSFIGHSVGKTDFQLDPNQWTRASAENRHRICQLAFEAFKYLKFIDKIINATQFLVSYPELLDSLSLTKILLYQVMKYNFEIGGETGFTLENDVNLPIPQRIILCIKGHKIHLAAAFARIRIEKQAVGVIPEDILKNFLPDELRKQDAMANQMVKYARINTCKVSKEQVLRKLQKLDIPVDMSEYGNLESQQISTDKDFDNLLIIPPSLYSVVSESELVQKGWIVLQDKASLVGPVQLIENLNFSEAEPCILDARAGNGTRASILANLMHNRGKIFALEDRDSRLNAMRKRFQLYNIQNVEIIPSDFLSVDPTDPHFENVTAILCEPPNSGSSIVDRFGYIMQEEELPEGDYDPKNIKLLQDIQLKMVEHCFKFPKLSYLIYVTRSTEFEENEEIVSDILDRYPVELDYVLPQFSNEDCEEFEFVECLKLAPTDCGNGIFAACFHIIRPEDLIDESVQLDLEEELEPIKLTPKKKKGSKKSHQSLPSLVNLSSRDSFKESKNSISSSRRTLNEVTSKESFTDAQNSTLSLNRFDPSIYVLGINIFKTKETVVTGKPIKRLSYPVPNPIPWK